MKAAYLLSKEVLPYLRKRHGGSIVYISSIAGFDPLGVSIKNDFKLEMYTIRPVKICHQIIGILISNHISVGMYYMVSQSKPCLCVPYNLHNKQQLFPKTALSGWCL